jgi:hypothetical protein
MQGERQNEPDFNLACHRLGLKFSFLDFLARLINLFSSLCDTLEFHERREQFLNQLNYCQLLEKWAY